MEQINKIVEKFISETELVDMQDFLFINRLIEIYERHYKEVNVGKYKSKVPFKKSFQYSYDFLKSINPSYAEYLKKCKDDGIIDAIEKTKEEKEAYSTIENGKNKIYIPIKQTIEDSYALTHEVIHDMSISNDVSEARHIFCEMLSLLGEQLQYDYFKLLKIKNVEIEPMKVLNAIKEKCEIIKFEQQLISIYLNKSKIDVVDISELSSNFNIEFIIDALKYMKNNNDLSIDIEQRYVIGYLFSCYVIDRMKINKKNIEEFFELNEMINYYEIEDVIDYLDLELKDSPIFELTDDSYDRIEKSYIKRIKGR